MSETIVCPHGCGKQWTGESNRVADQPLEPEASAAADQALRANCTRLLQPDGSVRALTMSDDDYCCRRVWMDNYLAAIDQPVSIDPVEGEQPGEDPGQYPGDGVEGCPKAFLKVRVTDYAESKPIEGVTVDVSGLGRKVTGADGVADYGEIVCGDYTATASKKDHAPKPGDPEGPAQATKYAPGGGVTTVIELQLDPLIEILRENVIIIGSERHYRSFWWKMMFVAGAFVAAKQARPADKYTLLLVDFYYTPLELARLKTLPDYTIVSVKSKQAILDHLSTRPEIREGNKVQKFKLQDVYVFAHGGIYPTSQTSEFWLNLEGDTKIDITYTDIAATPKDLFVPDGAFYSYACRTGISVFCEKEAIFPSDEAAKPENSLAQLMANHYGISVHAFHRRTDYTYILRDPSDSWWIGAAVHTWRYYYGDEPFDISEEFEALPHPGLSQDADWEGTTDYALWRKAGGREMPGSAETPFGTTPGMFVYRPA